MLKLNFLLLIRECHCCHVHFYRNFESCVCAHFRNFQPADKRTKTITILSPKICFARTTIVVAKISLWKIHIFLSFFGCHRSRRRWRFFPLIAGVVCVFWTQLTLHISRGIQMLTCLNSGKCFVYESGERSFYFVHVSLLLKMNGKRIVNSAMPWDKKISS